MKIVFKNVMVVNATGQEVQDVFVEDGKIVASLDAVDREVDGSGKFLLPGAIDPHVHFREPGSSHKETWETGSLSAAVGGVTMVIDMPNTKPATTTREALEEKKALVAGRSYVNYGFHFGATGNLDELRAVEGVCGVKVYMGSSTGDLLVDKPSVWEEIFTIAKSKGIPVIVHAEDEERIRTRLREHLGQDEPVVHAEIRDCECARIAAEAAMQLREKIGNKLHLAHMSTKSEVALMRQYAHTDLSCEVAPHHLFFNKGDMEDNLLKMNPPLRSEESVVRLWEGVRDGTVTCLATDHAPHTLEEKSRLHWDAPSGVPGVEFLLPLMLNEVNGKMLTLERVVDLSSRAPAHVFGLHTKGAIEVGMDADLVLVDMEKEQTITREMVKSKCGWSPYEGYILKGWPVMTVVNGQIIVENGELVGEACGQFSG